MPTHPETPHLAIIPDNVDPNQIDISMGMSQPGLPSGSYHLSPAPTGLVNRDPAAITPDGQIYCYELQFGGVLLLRLVDTTTLRVEARATAANCASQQPFGFTVGASFDYKR
jgi:hypothetical protein